MYHLHTGRQVEPSNKTIIERLQHYAAVHCSDWDIFLQTLTYTCNAQGQRSKNMSLFGIVFSRHLATPTSFGKPTALPTDSTATTSRHALKASLLQHVATMPQEADKNRNSRSGNIWTIMIRKFAMPYCRLSQKSTSTSTGHQYRHLPLNVWRLGRARSWCP